jgi:hypothetical protein
MKSLVTAIGILVLLVITIILSMFIVKGNMEYIQREVENIERLANSGGAVEAGEYAKEAEEEVMRKLDMCEIFINHNDSDQISLSYLRIMGFLVENQRGDAFSEIEALKFILERIKLKDMPNLNGIF